MIRWEDPLETVVNPIPLERTLVSMAGEDSFTLVQLHIDDEGDFNIAFHMTISGAERTLPEVEDFIRRIRAFIDAEPVLPDPPAPL